MQKLVKKNLEKKPSKIGCQKSPDKKPKNKSKFLKFNKAKRAKSLLFFKKVFKRKVSGRPFKQYKLLNKKKFIRLTIRVVPNNIFCTIKDNQSNKVLKSVSSGSYKINLSKKGLRYYAKLVVTSFLKDLRDIKIKFNKSLIVKVIAPVQIRRQIMGVLSSSLLGKFSSKKNAILEVESKKVFNGCRPRKKIRKKRKGLRLFK
jgi:ribosomal protein S11